MKNIIMIMVVAIIGLSTTMVNAQKKQMDEFTVQVDGLGCPFCAFGLEKKFKEFKGIKEVAIDIETGVFKFLYPSDKALAMTDVEKQVVKAGYTPITAEIKRADGNIETSKSAESTISKTANISETTIVVAGNCGMCEARIEKAAKSFGGVAYAEWDKDTKMLVLKFDKSKVSVDDIEKAIAKAGHDTKNNKADGKTYDELPGCCHYERIQ